MSEHIRNLIHHSMKKLLILTSCLVCVLLLSAACGIEISKGLVMRKPPVTCSANIIGVGSTMTDMSKSSSNSVLRPMGQGVRSSGGKTVVHGHMILPGLGQTQATGLWLWSIPPASCSCRRSSSPRSTFPASGRAKRPCSVTTWICSTRNWMWRGGLPKTVSGFYF